MSLKELINSIDEHRFKSSAAIPGFLEELRLPGEAELLSKIGTLSHEVEALEVEAQELANFRMIVGPYEGETLELLIIQILNRIFDRTEVIAEDRAESFHEDFWITNGTDDLAICEAKGIGTNVRREHINQVDDHRSRLELEPEALPGLLVVNIFRGSDDLVRRQTPLSPEVIRHAVRQNVLVLRTWDLYKMLGRSWSHDSTGAEFLSRLTEGGGWLEVDVKMELHTDG